MKKRMIACLIVITFASGTSFAQDNSVRKNEINLGYGVLTNNDLMITFWEAMGNVGHKILYRDSILNQDGRLYGAFNLQYKRQLSKVVRLGVVGSVNPIEVKTEYNKGYVSYNSYYFATVMPRVDFCYVNQKIFSLYSGIAVGASYWMQHYSSAAKPDVDDNIIVFNYHINFIGIRVGKDIGGFMECGFGALGTVNFGLSAKF